MRRGGGWTTRWACALAFSVLAAGPSSGQEPERGRTMLRPQDATRGAPAAASTSPSAADTAAELLVSRALARLEQVDVGVSHLALELRENAASSRVERLGGLEVREHGLLEGRVHDVALHHGIALPPLVVARTPAPSVGRLADEHQRALTDLEALTKRLEASRHELSAVRDSLGAADREEAKKRVEHLIAATEATLHLIERARPLLEEHMRLARRLDEAAGVEGQR